MEHTKPIVEVQLFDWSKSPADGRFVGVTLVESEQPEHLDPEMDAEGKPKRDADGSFGYDEAEEKSYDHARDEAKVKAIAEARRHSLSAASWRAAHLWDEPRVSVSTTTLAGTSKLWQPYMNRLLTIEECIEIGRHPFD